MSILAVFVRSLAHECHRERLFQRDKGAARAPVMHGLQAKSEYTDKRSTHYKSFPSFAAEQSTLSRMRGKSFAEYARKKSRRGDGRLEREKEAGMTLEHVRHTKWAPRVLVVTSVRAGRAHTSYRLAFIMFAPKFCQLAFCGNGNGCARENAFEAAHRRCLACFLPLPLSPPGPSLAELAPPCAPTLLVCRSQ